MEYTEEEWKAKGKKLFGDDVFKWQFKCPNCGHVQTPEDFRKFKKDGANPNSAYQECSGRYSGSKDGECDWASFGLFSGPSFVGETPVFDFREEVPK